MGLGSLVSCNMALRHPYGGSGAHLLIDQAKPVCSVNKRLESPAKYMNMTTGVLACKEVSKT